MLDQNENESEGTRSARRSSGCQTCYRIVVGLCGIGNIDSRTKTINSYWHVHGILSTVLQAVRLTYETLAEASYGGTTAYAGKLHSLLCTIYIANMEPCPMASTLIAN